jgi:predicted RNase H-like HicB family nuclease
LKTYPVIVHKDPDSDFGVTVPDLPGCFSAGTTLSEALTNTLEAISGHLECFTGDGEAIPEASELEVYSTDAAYADAYLKTIVSFDLA